MNQETFPASLFPLRGDVSAESGAISVRVQGIQNTPVTAVPPLDGQSLMYIAASNLLVWSAGFAAVRINGVGVSPDAVFFTNTALTINYSTDDFLGVRVNGV